MIHLSVFQAWKCQWILSFLWVLTHGIAVSTFYFVSMVDWILAQVKRHALFIEGCCLDSSTRTWLDGPFSFICKINIFSSVCAIDLKWLKIEISFKYFCFPFASAIPLNSVFKRTVRFFTHFCIVPHTRFYLNTFAVKRSVLILMELVIGQFHSASKVLLQHLCKALPTGSPVPISEVCDDDLLVVSCSQAYHIPRPIIPN